MKSVKFKDQYGEEIKISANTNEALTNYLVFLSIYLHNASEYLNGKGLDATARCVMRQSNTMHELRLKVEKRKDK